MLSISIIDLYTQGGFNMRKLILLLVLTTLLFTFAFSLVPTTESFLNLYINNMVDSLIPQAKTVSKWVAEKSIQWAITDNQDLLTEAQKLANEYAELEDVQENPFTPILNQTSTSKMKKKELIREKIRFEQINNDIIVYMLNPRIFNKGGRTTLTYLIGNTSNTVLKDFNIEIDSVYMPDTQEILSHNDDVYETVELEPGGLEIVQFQLSTDLEQLSGEYYIKYQFDYRKNSDEIITKYQKTPVILSGPNQMIHTLGISPMSFQRGSRMEMTFFIKNHSNKIYHDIDLEIETIEREIFQEPLGNKDDHIEDITLRPGEEGQIKVIIDTDIDDPEGIYNLRYYFHFYELNGDDYRTPLYIKKITVVKANDDLKCFDLEPLSMPQNARVFFYWYVKNTGEQFFKDINIEIDRITKDITGETLSHNDDIEEDFVLMPLLNTRFITRIQTDEDSPLGTYSVFYKFYFEDEQANRYETDEMVKTIEVIPPSQQIKCVEISPTMIQRGKDNFINFKLLNTSDNVIEDINLEVETVFRDIYGETLPHNDDLEKNIDLKPEEEKIIPVRIRAKHDDIPGTYILRYYLYFNDNLGNRYETSVFYTYLTLE